MALRRPKHVLIIVLLVAWCYDALFWRKSSGLSFVLFVGLLLVAGFTLAIGEQKRPKPGALWLLAPIGVFTLMPILRLEPMTVFASVMLTLALLMLLAHTFRGGRWTAYSLSDFIAVPFRLFASAVARPYDAYRQNKELSSEKSGAGSGVPWRLIGSVFFGLALATPALLVFGSLLSSADPIFADRLADFLRRFNLEKLFEYLVRASYILLLAYALAGIYLYALAASQEEKLIGLDKPVLQPFLGPVEASIILVCVNLLFSAFVIIQFQYFFGGRTNIHIDGLTYAEYARRGFGELVLVAFFSLLLFWCLSQVTRRETSTQRKSFSALGVLLGICVVVILLSAFQRLLLYENAFGFSRLRIYPHVFMVWLGFLLAAFILLELAGRPRAFGLALLFVTLGFGLTLGSLNVDGFIARRNVARARLGSELDLDYLLTLSADSTPALSKLYRSNELETELQDQIGAILACQAAKLEKRAEGQSWNAFHFSAWRAQRLLDRLEPALRDYPVMERSGSYSVTLDGEVHACEGRWELD